MSTSTGRIPPRAFFGLLVCALLGGSAPAAALAEGASPAIAPHAAAAGTAGPNSCAGLPANPARIEVKVLALIYNPTSGPAFGYQTLQQQYPWFPKIDPLIQTYIGDMVDAGAGAFCINVVERYDLDELPPANSEHVVAPDGLLLVDDFRWVSPDVYFHNVAHLYGGLGGSSLDLGGHGGSNYHAILNDPRFGITGKIDSGAVTMVWILSDPLTGFWEAAMAGPGAYWVNGVPIAGIATSRRFVVLAHGLDRSVECWEEVTAHMTENILKQVSMTWPKVWRHGSYGPFSDWDRFQLTEWQNYGPEMVVPGYAQVGTAHYPPNSPVGSNYAFYSEVFVDSHADDWFNYPDFRGVKKPVNRESWNTFDGDYHRGFQHWWFSHIPHNPGSHDGILNNWWPYVWDVNRNPNAIPAVLKVTKTDDRKMVVPGQEIAYTIVVSNPGPSTVGGARVTDTLPAALVQATARWTCVPSTGAWCTPSGTGSIDDLVILPVGGSVTYTLRATVGSNPVGLTNTARVTVSANYDDPDPSDDTATDTDLLVCGDDRPLVPDGRPLGTALPAGASRWLALSTRPGASYSLEVQGARGGWGPAVELFRGDDGCGGVSTATMRETSFIEPAAVNAVRLSFTAPVAGDSSYHVRLRNPTLAAADYQVSLAETTAFSAAWSTNGSYDTYYSLQNTTSATITATLALSPADGTSAAELTIAIPARATSSVNTSSAGIPRNRTGSAQVTHDAPPGALIVEAAIANFSFRPAYVQPVKVRSARERR